MMTTGWKRKPLNLVQGTSCGSIDHVFKGCSAIAVKTKSNPNDWNEIDQENLDQEINWASKKRVPLDRRLIAAVVLAFCQT
jgi:hypothetical protein